MSTRAISRSGELISFRNPSINTETFIAHALVVSGVPIFKRKPTTILKFAMNLLTKSRRNRYVSGGMRELVRIQVIGAGGAIVFEPSVLADDWPYYQHDASHTGDSSAVVTAQALSPAWTAPSPRPNTSDRCCPPFYLESPATA